ncbi:MAG TPA: acyloxyacyl hydrolase [Magnetospirillum sp.]|jgi:lipid A 3-O-deacylase|nr:acyloxyacyl hydrolase [Magnetospirillum sp.]
MKAVSPTSVFAALVVLTPVPTFAGPVSELRFGVFDHDIGFLGNNKEKGVDINGEVLFDSPDFLGVVWSPRPTLGASINTSGYTDQFYGALTWQFEPVQDLFLEFSLGGSVHTGSLEYVEGSSHKDLGTRALFRESIAVGYRIDQHNSISVAFDHESNAGIGPHNPGLNNVGLRWGYRF